MSAAALPSSPLLTVRDLGLVRYAEALDMQRAAHAALVASRDSDDPVRSHGAPMTLLLLEHDPPVITVSRRPGASRHLIATPEMLARAGIEIAETDRGGDITYHGPGQLVAYPILDLNWLGLRVHSYMRWLESIVLETIASFGVHGHRDGCATGVWVGGDPDAGMCPGDRGEPARSTGGRKICALGVRVSRWCSMHGLALNVSTNLAHFGLIVPCGLAGRPVTSLAAECGGEAPPMASVKEALARRFVRSVDEATAAVALSRPDRADG